MRYLVITDIHANLEALDVCLADADRRGYERTLVLGDIVGYGPDPNAVVNRIVNLDAIAIVRGNHDKIAFGIQMAEGFNVSARVAAQWTLNELTPEHKDWLMKLPQGMSWDKLADLHGRTVHAPPPTDTGANARRRPFAAGAAPGGAPGAAAPARLAPNRGNGIGQSGCHDITSYPDIGFAGGACAGYGLVFDIRDAKNPKRLVSVADSNMSFWHSATFSNDGSKLLFSDEWGGGTAPRCRITDKKEWGGNAIFTLDGGQLHFKSYYKMPAPQTNEEICTAHNGNLIPVPGRDIMVQAFYMGGATVFDWTDPANPIEIAFYDRGPGGGYWSTYWYNGVIVASDEQRGMDIHELTPSPYLSQNEIDAAKSVHVDQYNAQQQTHITWPPTFSLARAYLDQLERNGGLSAARIAAVRTELTTAERASGSARSSALSASASAISADISGASDKGRVTLLQRAVHDLSNVK